MGSKISFFLSRFFRFKGVHIMRYFTFVFLYRDSAGTSGTCKCLFYQEFRLKRVMFSQTPMYNCSHAHYLHVATGYIQVHCDIIHVHVHVH